MAAVMGRFKFFVRTQGGGATLIGEEALHHIMKDFRAKFDTNAKVGLGETKALDSFQYLLSAAKKKEKAALCGEILKRVSNPLAPKAATTKAQPNKKTEIEFWCGFVFVQLQGRGQRC